MRLRSISTFSISACLLAGATATLAHASSVEYLVTVNTLLVAAQPGYINLEFDPAFLGGQSATAEVTGFTMTGGTLNAGSVTTQGDVSGGPLPSSVTFDNGTDTNYYLEGLTFGSAISFDLTLDGQMIESPNGTGGGTTFYVDFYDGNGNPNLTTDPSGAVGYVTINPNGTTTVTENPGPTGGASEASFTLVPAMLPTPEPSAWSLLAAGLIGIAAFGRRRWQASGSRSAV